MRICWAQLQLVTSTAFYVLTENKAKESIKSVIWKSRVWALMLLWSGAWTWQSWLSDKIGFNDNNTISGPPDWSVSGPGRMIVMVSDHRAGVPVCQYRGDIFIIPSLICGQAGNADMDRDMRIAWWRIIKFSLTFIRSVPICSWLTAVSPHDQIFWLRLTRGPL